jgi:cadmium resistance protein CadD (predicted permease)
MAMLLGFIAAITLVMWLAPGSEAGRALNRQLVERPLEALSDIKRHHLIFFVIIFGFAIGGGEAIALLGPEFVTAYALDLAIFIDAVMVTYALTAVAAAKGGGGRLKDVVVRAARRVRPRSKRTTRRADTRPKSANDDDPAPAICNAA